MGTEALTEKERQMLEHLNHAKELGTPLTEFALCRMRHKAKYAEGRTMPNTQILADVLANLRWSHSA